MMDEKVAIANIDYKLPCKSSILFFIFTQFHRKAW